MQLDGFGSASSGSSRSIPPGVFKAIGHGKKAGRGDKGGKGGIQSANAAGSAPRDKSTLSASHQGMPEITEQWCDVGRNGKAVKRTGNFTQWEGRVLSIDGRKGLIVGRRKQGDRGELCFFYPQDLSRGLKKGDHVRFDVDLNEKRREYHHLKACNVQNGVERDTNPQ